MADIVTELRNDAMRFWLPNSEARRRSTVVAAADEIVRLRALLGNAVGAVIDSGGYCEGPHDVAAAIYRLTEERDELRAAVSETRPSYRTRAEHDRIYAEWQRTRGITAADPEDLRPAPGVSETHTDPKEDR